MGLRALFKDGGTIGEYKDIDWEFDLKTKLFNSTLPLNLKLNDNDENPDLRLTVKVSFAPTADVTGSVLGFKLRLGGLLAEAKNISLKAGTAGGSAEFTAATSTSRRATIPTCPRSTRPTHNCISSSKTSNIRTAPSRSVVRPHPSKTGSLAMPSK